MGAVPDATLAELERRVAVRRERPAYGHDALITCDRLVRIFATYGVEVQALQGLDLLVTEGELLALVGASGSGKSTLMNILAGLDIPTAGAARVAGHDLLAMTAADRLRYRREVVGFVWQQTSRNLLPYLTAAQNVSLPMQLRGRRGWGASARSTDKGGAGLRGTGGERAARVALRTEGEPDSRDEPGARGAGSGREGQGSRTGPAPVRRAGRTERRRATERALDLLGLLGVADCRDRRPHEMSGGQQQRVAIAVALANDPAVLLADEPTGELDSTRAGQIFGAFRTANEQLGTTIVIVTHDAAVAREVRRTVAIRDGRTATEVLRRTEVDEATGQETLIPRIRDPGPCGPPPPVCRVHREAGHARPGDPGTGGRPRRRVAGPARRSRT